MAKKKKKTTNREIKIEKKIEELRKEIKEVIKEKSILDSQRVGKKIDDIIDNEFIDELRGNSNPGVFEKLRNTEEHIKNIKEFNKELKGNGKPSITQEVRNLKKNIKVIWMIIGLIVIFSLGGSYRGITIEKIKEKFGIGKNVEIKNVEEEKKEDVEIVGNREID